MSTFDDTLVRGTTFAHVGGATDDRHINQPTGDTNMPNTTTVRVYDIDQTTMAQTLRDVCDVHDMFDATDDGQVEECLGVIRRLGKDGEVWLGGGASPLVRVVLVKPWPKEGERVKLVRDVERYPHFTAKAGMVGTVVESEQDELHGMFVVKMDEHIDGAEPWDNDVCWTTDEDPMADVVGV